MKRTIFALSALVFALSNTACSEDGLDDKSVITGIGYEIETPFDEWLLENFIEPYNIRVMYRYEDMESDMTYNLVPARYERSIEMAQLVSYLCLQAYDEITGSRDFIRANFPKDLFFVGSPAYNNNGSTQCRCSQLLLLQNDTSRVRAYPQSEKALHVRFRTDRRQVGRRYPLCRQFLLGGISHRDQRSAGRVHQPLRLDFRRRGVRGARLDLRHQHARSLGNETADGRRETLDDRAEIRHRL